MICIISDKDYKKLVEKKSSACYNINVVNAKGLISLLKSVILRMGLLFGIIVTLVFMADITSRLWDIKIFSNEQLAIRQFEYDCNKSPFGKDLTLYYLGEYDIETGKIIPQVNFVMNAIMAGGNNE